MSTKTKTTRAELDAQIQDTKDAWKYWADRTLAYLQKHEMHTGLVDECLERDLPWPLVSIGLALADIEPRLRQAQGASHRLVDHLEQLTAEAARRDKAAAKRAERKAAQA